MVAKWVDVGSVGSFFESLSDPRHTRNRKHLLLDIVIIAVCGMVCGCEGPTALHRWARTHWEWLGQFLELPHGIPSRDCIRRLLMVLEPSAFQECFQAWIAAAARTADDGRRRLVAIDGKTCRRAHDLSKDLGPLHVVSAWASEEGIALGQVATDDKSNEITAIPQLLEQLDLTKTVVTIDAMGCQKEIAAAIVEGGGDFVLAVKDNQPKLKEAIEASFEKQLASDFEDLQYRANESSEQGHGRVDERSYYLAKVPKDFAPKKEWPWIKAIGMSLRVTRNAKEEPSHEIRYYITSRYLSGPRFRDAVRQHWGIESMHWVLDVIFREDETRARADAGQQSELAAALRDHPLETPSREGEHQGQDATRQLRHRLSRPSPGFSEGLICAGRVRHPVPDCPVRPGSSCRGAAGGGGGERKAAGSGEIFLEIVGGASRLFVTDKQANERG